jgi:hypothetical protein
MNRRTWFIKDYGKETVQGCTLIGFPHLNRTGCAMATVKDGNDTEEFYKTLTQFRDIVLFATCNNPDTWDV